MIKSTFSTKVTIRKRKCCVCLGAMLMISKSYFVCALCSSHFSGWPELISKFPQPDSYLPLSQPLNRSVSNESVRRTICSMYRYLIPIVFWSSASHNMNEWMNEWLTSRRHRVTEISGAGQVKSHPKRFTEEGIIKCVLSCTNQYIKTPVSFPVDDDHVHTWALNQTKQTWVNSSIFTAGS